MSKFFKVGKHARDLASVYVEQVQNCYIEVLELFAGLRKPAKPADRVYWMCFQPGDDRLPAIAAAYAASLLAVLAVQAGVTSLEDIRAKWDADIAKVRAAYPDYDSLIDAVVWRVTDIFDHLGYRPEDHI